MQQFIQGTTKKDEANYQTKEHSQKASGNTWAYKGAHGLHEKKDARRYEFYTGSQNGYE